MPSSSTRSVDGSDGNISPDSYELKEVIFHSNARKRIDIKAYIQKIELFENINSPFIEAVVSIQDASSFFEQQKVTGDESVDIKIKRTPLDGTKEKVSEFNLKFKIAEVFNFLRDGPSVQFYKFRLVSKHLYTNQVKSLQRSFQGSIGKLVKDICKKDLHVSKATINSDTKDIIKGVYPTIKPIQAINWLLKNAFDNGTPYFFYETLNNGLQFNSLENLYEKEVYETYEFLPYFDHDVGTSDSYNEQRARIVGFGSDFNMGKLNDVGEGAYASTLHTLDLATKKYTKTFYNYDSSKPKTISKNKPFSDNKAIDRRKYGELKEAKHFFVSLNSGAYPSHKNYHSPAFTTILKSESHLQTLGFNTHEISLPGDFGLQVGNKVHIKMIKPTTIEDADMDTVMLDKYNSGDYLVTGIIHTFNNFYTMLVTIQRDSTEVNVDA
jgi:hypothetical protein